MASSYASVRERTGCEEKAAPATTVEVEIAVLQLKKLAGPALTTMELPAPEQTEREPSRDRDDEQIESR